LEMLGTTWILNQINNRHLYFLHRHLWIYEAGS